MAGNEEPIPEKAMDSLEEATQRIRAVEDRLLAAGNAKQLSYRNVFTRMGGTLAMPESALLEARRRHGKCKKGAKGPGLTLGPSAKGSSACGGVRLATQGAQKGAQRVR